MRKRVGIITIHRAHNVGAALQVFSLTKAISALGHDCRIIDYCPRVSRQNAIRGIRGLNLRLQGCIFKKQIRNAETRFSSFQNELPLTSYQLSAPSDFESADLDFDVMITGSDQIWNPRQFPWEVSGPYYLSFLRDQVVRRVAYAASFGVDKLTASSEQIQWMAEQIKKYDFISVRELHGVRIVEELTAKQALHVLDPTLLVSPESLMEIVESPKIKTGYIFIYPTQFPPNAGYIQFVKRLAKRTQLQIVIYACKGVHPLWFLRGANMLFDVGPKQFLGLIKNATYVVTNSFHGTAISIAFKKDFFVIPHTVYNSRMNSLLSLIGLTDRQLDGDAIQGDIDLFTNSVEYAQCDGLLCDERQKSLSFLEKAIDG